MHKEIGKKIIKQFLQLEEVKRIFTIFGNEEIRLVGGCVRDALLEKDFNDIDFATTLPPVAVMARFAEHQIKTFATGIKFGTITALINGKNFEITTLRNDLKCDGRFAQVEFTTSWEEDAKRRDFTINALSLNAAGELYDYFNGLADLERGVVTFIGNPDTRIEEDYLRILRFFRFSAYYSAGKVEEVDLWACRRKAINMLNLSGERISAELFKILASEKAATILSVMESHQILMYILPFITSNFRPLEKLVDLELQLDLEPNPLRRFAILIQDSSKLDPVLISYSLRLSRVQTKYLTTHSIVEDRLTKQNIKEIIRKKGKKYSVDRLLMQWARELAQGHYVSEDNLEYFNFIKQYQIPIFPVSGADLLALGMGGKNLGDRLNQLEEYWVEQNYKLAKNELLTYLSSL